MAGTSTDACVETSMPDHDLSPFIVTPKASCSLLVSVGSNTEGTSECYSFFDKHTFRIDGLQVFKDPTSGKLDTRFDNSRKKVNYVGTKQTSH